jgi:hypothetical protein
VTRVDEATRSAIPINTHMRHQYYLC